MSKNHFVSHFLPFQINTTIFIFVGKYLLAATLYVRKSLSVAFLPISDQYKTFFYQMATGAHFDRISGHFRSIRNFIFFGKFLFLWILFTKWLLAAILNVRKSLSVAFLAISDQYDFFLNFVFTKWLPSAIFDVRNSLWIIFLAILDQYRFFLGHFLQNGCRWPFWMS